MIILLHLILLLLELEFGILLLELVGLVEIVIGVSVVGCAACFCCLVVFVYLLLAGALDSLKALPMPKHRDISLSLL